MPGATTPDDIVYPVTGDQMAPLNNWFAQQAASVQTALTNLRAEALPVELPLPLSEKGANVQAVTATAWADLPNIAPITLTLPQPAYVTIVLGAWVTTGAGTNVRASVRVSGATTLGESQVEVGGDAAAWGQVLYTDSTTGTRQGSSIRTVRLNAGANTITVRAYKQGAAVSQVNYSTLQVSPIRWA